MSHNYIFNDILSNRFQNDEKAEPLWWDNADIFDDSSFVHCSAQWCALPNPKSTSAQSQIRSWHTFIRPPWSNMYGFHSHFLKCSQNITLMDGHSQNPGKQLAQLCLVKQAKPNGGQWIKEANNAAGSVPLWGRSEHIVMPQSATKRMLCSNNLTRGYLKTHSGEKSNKCKQC